MVFLWTTIFIFAGLYLEVELLACMVTLCVGNVLNFYSAILKDMKEDKFTTQITVYLKPFFLSPILLNTPFFHYEKC